MSSQLAAVPAALGAAAANATASVLQRRAARRSPPEQESRRNLITELIRRRVWLAGIGCLIAAFLLQAVALYLGGLSLVQPLLTAELPFTLLLASRLSRTPLDRAGWHAIAALTAGLALLLVGAAPSPGQRTPSTTMWVIAAASTGALAGALTAIGHRRDGPPRGALLGTGSGVGFALTAALMKDATQRASHGFGALFGSWLLYAMAGAGVGSLLLLQYALQSATLAVTQPALTTSDPIASTLLGVTMFGERIRLGGWIVLEAAGIGLMLWGAMRLASNSASSRQAGRTRL
ncbi:DMT family transporter [Actinocrinis puniceicyclus]|uniref:DMT family transporter n=1 Tax=Actinocrinis puniceicyclus TaxID=977794 RepID=A0A8J7WP69_9ACTN|nr:DMT family transporter [Actinocrinis puniceicyclus]MBS2963347.1 DMT family transporter [Actinocrinis puniceicyclus]